MGTKPERPNIETWLLSSRAMGVTEMREFAFNVSQHALAVEAELEKLKAGNTALGNAAVEHFEGKLAAQAERSEMRLQRDEATDARDAALAEVERLTGEVERWKATLGNDMLSAMADRSEMRVQRDEARADHFSALAGVDRLTRGVQDRCESLEAALREVVAIARVGKPDDDAPDSQWEMYHLQVESAEALLTNLRSGALPKGNFRSRVVRNERNAETGVYWFGQAGVFVWISIDDGEDSCCVVRSNRETREASLIVETDMCDLGRHLFEALEWLKVQEAVEGDTNGGK